MLGRQSSALDVHDAWALPAVDDSEKEPEKYFIAFDESPPNEADFLAEDILRPHGAQSPLGFAATGGARRPLPRLPPGSGSAPFGFSSGHFAAGAAQRARSATPTDGRMSSLSSCSTPAPRSDSPRSSCSTPSGSGIRAARALAQYAAQFEPAHFDTSRDDAATDMLDESGAQAAGAGAGAGGASHPRPPPPRPLGSKPPAFRRSPTPSGAHHQQPPLPPMHSQTDPTLAHRINTPSPTGDFGPSTSDGSGGGFGGATRAAGAGAATGGGALSPGAGLPPRQQRRTSSLPELTVRGSLAEDEMELVGPHTGSPARQDSGAAAGGRDTPQSPGGSGPPLFDWDREGAEGEEVFSENAFLAGAFSSSSYG